MSNYNTKNYTEQGGEKTVIGGELVVEEAGALNVDGEMTVNEGGSLDVDGSMTIESGATLVIKSGATFTNENEGEEEETVKIPYMAPSTQSSAANVAKDFNGLLALLKAVGLMNTTAPTISITAQPEDAACNTNGSVSLSVAASVTDGRPIGYQWYSNSTETTVGGTKVTPNGTGTTISPPTNAAGTIYYYCIVSDGSGALTESVAPVTSDIVAVVVS